MAEQDDSVGGVEIDAVIQTHGRGQAGIVQLHHVPSQPTTVEAIGQHIDTGRRHDQPETIYFFLGIDDACNMGEGDSGKNREERPEHTSSYFHARHTNNPPVACKSSVFPLFSYALAS